MNEKHEQSEELEGAAAGRALISQGIRLGKNQQLEQAVLCLVQGLSRVEAAEEPRLVLSALHNLALFLAHLGMTVIARAVVELASPLYQDHGDALMAVRLEWLKGTIAHISGEHPKAAESLRLVVESLEQIDDEGLLRQARQELAEVERKLRRRAA